MGTFRWSRAPLSLKLTVTVYLVTVSLAYIMGMVNVYNTTGLTHTGIVTRYRGNEEAAVAPMSFQELVQTTHVHMFGISLVLLTISLAFALTQLPERVKACFIVLPFVCLVVDFLSQWLLVYQSHQFAYVTSMSGLLLAVSFALLIGRPLYEMWMPSRPGK